ncbi:hypothetical protein V6R21_32355 [Limibacter armeniacum]|uniref:hypothetical protein n=1 Tax=Limibacter armeniacum TaxID=466084 RepID=UPI002FE51104
MDLNKNLNHIQQLAEGHKRTDTINPFDHAWQVTEWKDQNCLKCRKCLSAHHPKYELPLLKESIQLVKTGQECIGKLALEIIFYQDTIPIEVAEMMGIAQNLNDTCKAFEPLTKHEKKDPNQLNLF